MDRSRLAELYTKINQTVREASCLQKYVVCCTGGKDLWLSNTSTGICRKKSARIMETGRPLRYNIRLTSMVKAVLVSLL
jgi:hypothetical protein